MQNDILEYARLFVTDAIEGGVEDVLAAAIADGTTRGLLATQMCYEEMYGGFTYNYEIKAPAAWCLLAFGTDGLRALVEGAVRTPKSKNQSLTLEILSTAATERGAELGSYTHWIHDEQLSESVRRALAAGTLVEPARTLLREYVIGLGDEANRAVPHTLGTLGMASALQHNDDAIRELFAAAALRWLTVDHAAVAEFDRLVDQEPRNEPAFQAFFERHPQFLDPMATTIWPKPDFHGFREPDFVIRRTDDTYVVVEIETPAKSLMTATNPPRPSAECTNAEAQILEYRRFLNGRLDEVRHHFAGLANIEGLVVVGLERDLTADQAQALAEFNAAKHGLKIVGFDWLKNRTVAIRDNLLHANLQVKVARIV